MKPTTIIYDKAQIAADSLVRKMHFADLRPDQRANAIRNTTKAAHKRGKNKLVALRKAGKGQLAVEMEKGE